VKAAVEAMKPQFERTSGHKLSIEFTTTASLKQRIDKGEKFDVAILTDDAVSDLVKSGHLIGYKRAALARVGIGVGFRTGAPKPDIRTAAAVKQAMLNAKSVAYTREGASRPGIDKMFATLGIASAIAPKANLTGPGQSPEAVAKGESDVVLTLISEILPVPGVDLAGPLPAEFQSYISFSAAPSSDATDTNAAQALVEFLDGTGAAAAYKTAGMEAVK
jgi:molybdate transport system substrate-binding protein